MQHVQNLDATMNGGEELVIARKSNKESVVAQCKAHRAIKNNARKLAIQHKAMAKNPFL